VVSVSSLGPHLLSLIEQLLAVRVLVRVAANMKAKERKFLAEGKDHTLEFLLVAARGE
jgi:hypothetical protein